MADLNQTEENNLAFDPNGGEKYTQRYLDANAIDKNDTAVSRLSSFYPAPKEYTPVQQEQTRNAASMAETLKSLAEIYGQSKGAFLQKRQPEESAKAENKILYEKNKYDQDLREYVRAMVGAMGQDSERVRQLRENAQRYGQAMYGNELALAKEKRQRQNKIDDDKADKEHNSRENKLNRDNATHNAYIRSRKSGKGGDDLIIAVPAHPNDPNAVVNPITKKRMANIPIEKKEIDAYYTRAMNNPEFFKKHPTLRTGDGILVQYKDADKSAIAHTQAQDEYDSQFINSVQESPKQKKQNVLVVPTKKVHGW